MDCDTLRIDAKFFTLIFDGGRKDPYHIIERRVTSVVQFGLVRRACIGSPDCGTSCAGLLINRRAISNLFEMDTGFWS
jgi:hypothetical protein